MRPPRVLLIAVISALFSVNYAAHRHHHGEAPASRELLDAPPHCLYHTPSKIEVPGYEWFSTEKLRHMTQVYPGNRARLRMTMDRYLKLGSNENLNVVFLGGSITAGQGAVDGKGFPFWAEEIFQKSKLKIQIRNGAVPGTLSSYMSVCHNMHVPKDADIIFVDYSVNDDYQTLPAMDNAVRRPFERLLRKLLSYPKSPAVIMIHSFIWHRVTGPSGLYWPSSERDHHDFAMYYGIPELSVKAGAWRLMSEGNAGYWVNVTRGDHTGSKKPIEVDNLIKGKVFYWDVIHPDGLTGHKWMGEMAAQAIFDALASVNAVPITEEDRQDFVKPLPVPMLPNNWQSSSDKCFIGRAFQTAVIESNGWQYKDEGKDPTRPKFGYISEIPGSELKIKINTESQSGDKEKLPVIIELSYLKSYVNMGKASVSCLSGCVCEQATVDAHHTEQNSQLHHFEWKASQHPECIVSVRLLPETSSGKNKFKVAGIMISEEAGAAAIKNNWAVAMVMEGANRDDKNGGTFDVRDWGKG